MEQCKNKLYMHSCGKAYSFRRRNIPKTRNCPSKRRGSLEMLNHRMYGSDMDMDFGSLHIRVICHNTGYGSKIENHEDNHE